ncbi:sugar 3,4-ketoisomerase [Pseudomonas cremoricolorata]|uniref:sugar 3,4-ketoisomerase n=1 Tax=Pseudomonas cremoricolorata TaxID=157783 RepID=UPI0024815B66|nr:FdtA/QdtA family cupin domain-containing protein [Pseudomonas cremoricolorata]
MNGVAAPVHSAQGLGLQFQIKGDQRGALVALERGGDVPFPIARVYYLTHTKPGISRGFHAHRELQQLAVCVAGRCRMLMDDGVSRVDYWLDTPDRGVLIPPGVWHEMHDFSDDCVLLVLASAPYEESDYIRDYSAFREAVKHG